MKNRFRFPFLHRSLARTEKNVQPSPDDEAQHSQEIDQFRAVLESFGASRIPERLSILNVFLSTENHVTISELIDLLQQKKQETVDRAFLQETMEMFCRYGFAQEISFENHETRYEHHHLGAHHDHFICTRCGLIQEFINPDLEQLQMHIAAGFGFHPLQHKTEIYGLCNQCMGQREKTMPLHLAMEGERVRIVRLLGGRAMQAKLAAMGLTVNSCLEVLSNRGAGPFIVALAGNRMALGKEISQNIMVAHSCRHAEIP